MDKAFFEQHQVVQVEGETDLAFRAFRTYLQSPPGRRSLRSLESEGFKWGSVGTWSRQHRWQERAKAFDMSVSAEGLDMLLNARQSLVVRSIEESLGDAQTLREEVLKQVPGASAEKLATLITSRIDLDNWQVQILSMLRAIEEVSYASSQD